MIISVTSSGNVKLIDADDFKGFKVRVDDPRASDSTVVKALNGIATVDATGHAWVGEEALRKLGAQAGGPGWQDSATGMLAYAKRAGWIDEKTGAIRAHIEWPAGARKS
ncbi:hypothetical protein [Bradyrhizobium sp. LHD-71]|uniref:hypothetical protein n=1 Tax=Bradyrhizobium sp. LHD-71 TaxID=3072141 RepID=UPI00280E8D50|nr:hypothetical protein [Bradyrhizobium sp. LHD-71]MDQ8727182.1 hypothetical protein [Bradyrhizobium sp. LHD-71]